VLDKDFYGGMRIEISIRIFDLTSHCQDGGYDVISRRKVLPPGE